MSSATRFRSEPQWRMGLVRAAARWVALRTPAATGLRRHPVRSRHPRPQRCDDVRRHVAGRHEVTDATHERELTEPVDLAAPDGRTLNPAARGWSRRPLHRANLHGGWGRTKRWDYWAILAGDLVVSSVYADVDYLGLADLWWVDLTTGKKGGKGIAAPLGAGLTLPDVPGTAPLRVRRRNFELEISDDADGKHAPAGHVARTRWRARASPRHRRAAAGPRVAQRRHPLERAPLPVHLEAPGPPGPRDAHGWRPHLGLW
jgi:Protein of unknown function (DUF2804)